MSDDKRDTQQHPPSGKEEEIRQTLLSGKEEGARHRVLTDKGKAYQVENKVKEFRKVVSKWRSQATKLQDILAQDAPEDLKREREYLRLHMDDVEKTYHVLEGALAEVDRGGKFDHLFNQVQKDHFELMKEYQSIKKSKSSIRSSNLTEKAALAVARAQELKIKEKYLEEELRHKLELEKCQLKKEIEIEQAKARALSEADRDDRLQDFKDENLIEEFITNQGKGNNDNQPPQATDGMREYFSQNAGADHQSSVRHDQRDNQPFPSQHQAVMQNQSDNQPLLSQQNVGVDINKTFAAQIELNRLPPPEPEIFSGDILKYPLWRTAFDILIGHKAIPDREKLYYLRKYLDGPAKEAVEGFLLLNTDDAYTNSRAMLDERYGDNYLLGNAFKDKLESWPKIRNNDGQALRRFTDFLRQCAAAKQNILGLSVLDDDRQNKQIIQKLPDWLIRSWSRVVNSSRESGKGFPKFEVFVEFMRKESSIACDPISSFTRAKPDERNKRGPSVVSHSHSTESKVTQYPCVCCKETTHYLDSCKEFLSKNLQDRRSFVQENSLCFGCLKRGHRSKDCRRRLTCNQCKKRHPTSLHGDLPKKQTQQTRTEPAPSADGNVTETVSHCGNSDTDGQSQKSSMILPVWISHRDKPGKEILAYALLDTQSDNSFITKEIWKKLNVEGVDVTLSLTTLSSDNMKVESRKVSNLQVRGYDLNQVIEVPPVYTREKIPANRTHIPTSEIADDWPHLKPISSVLPPIQSCPIGILIGYNCPQALAPREVICSSSSQAPFGQRTDLGWGIVGIVRQQETQEDDIGITHRVLARANSAEVIQQTTIKEDLGCEILKMMNLDFQEYEKEVLSVQEQKFLDIMESGLKKLPDGHYELPLPFKQNAPPQLPNNRILARRRLLGQRAKFASDKKFESDYVTFMNKMINNGHAERVCEAEQGNPRVWYVPHHGVYHPKKPDKIRVVFDCSSRYNCESLNDHLLPGPDLMNKLIGVLIRFRQEEVAFTCDIEAMFYQFRVSKDHRDLLRFLWWPDSQCKGEPVDYRMNVHLFGAVSSPACATFGLRQAAHDMEGTSSKRAVDFILRNFYVDDGIISVSTEEQAIDLIKHTKRICEASGLHLHKFLSNSKKVMETLPDSEKTTTKEDSLPSPECTQIERALGVQWCVESDTLRFRIVLENKPLTRRGILSTVSSIYDPLGLIAPVTLQGKKILQEMCRSKADWDDPLPDHLRPLWERWRSEIPKLSSLRIPRCYKANALKDVKRVELHHFSDASTSGYGECSYLRLQDQESVHVALVFGKARVAPLKTTSIPRLELTAALVAANVHKFLTKELDIEVDEEFFWTDSMTTLCYIKNESRRFHTFVGNRVQKIRDLTSPEKWFHVKGTDNPADFASRGVKPGDLTIQHCWFSGPSFLSRMGSTTPTTDVLPELRKDDPEVKKVKCLNTDTVEVDCFDLDRLQHVSSWYKAKRAIANCLMLKRRLLARVKSESTMNQSTVSTEDMEYAEELIVRELQRKFFAEEINVLAHSKAGSKETKQRLKLSSSISKLDPFLDGKNILRVGGRIRESSTPWEIKHPKIMPRKHNLTNLLVRHHHEKTHHQGRGMTTNEIRAHGYWIIGCSNVVFQEISRCVHCCKTRGKVQEQKMSDLPQERVSASAPFTYTGVDLFGPFFIKEGRKEIKRYGVIFTCLSSRSVHLETTVSLETDSFISALRRLISIRGPIRLLRSDRGTNFVGAKRELTEAWAEMNCDQLQTFLSHQDCDLEWKMNPPASSHMGGVWERQIRTIRSVLTSLLERNGTQLDDEGLRTFMCEAAAVVNSRPLSTDCLNDPSSLVPITPNQLLTMKTSLVLPPPGVFQREDLYARRRWRRIQYLSNEFWHRWKREYLQNLQVRQKWQRSRRNAEIGDIVLLKEDSEPRGTWKLAKVVDVCSSKDGIVRSVKLQVGDKTLDSRGRRIKEPSFLERPIHKTVLLLKNEELKESGVPVEEP